MAKCYPGIEWIICFREDPDVRTFNFSAAPMGIPHNIIVQHSLNVPSFLFCRFRELGRAEQPFFLSGKSDENNCCVELVLAENSGKFQNESSAAGIIVRARRSLDRIQYIAATGIVVPADD